MHGHINQWNRTGSPEINSHIYSHLIFNTGAKKNNCLFNKWCWDNWTDMWQRMELEHLLTPYTKNYSKWVFNLKLHLYSFREKKKKKENPHNLGRQNFLTRDIKSPKQTKNNKMDVKNTAKKLRSSYRLGKKLFANIYLTKDLYPKYKNLFKIMKKS